MLNKLTTEWVVIDGSIFLNKEEFVNMDGRPVKVRQPIAFNVPTTAKHIVALHNESLKKP